MPTIEIPTETITYTGLQIIADVSRQAKSPITVEDGDGTRAATILRLSSGERYCDVAIAMGTFKHSYPMSKFSIDGVSFATHGDLIARVLEEFASESRSK